MTIISKMQNNIKHKQKKYDLLLFCYLLHIILCFQIFLPISLALIQHYIQQITFWIKGGWYRFISFGIFLYR